MSVTLKAVMGCNLGCRGCYEAEVFRLRPEMKYYDFDKVMASLRKARSGGLALHGGEPLLLPLEKIRQVFELCREQQRRISIQTNATLITEAHIAIFREYGVGVGVSVNGPEDLNDDRQARDPSRTRQVTKRVHQNIERMVQAGLSVSIITVLSATNAGDDDRLGRLISWAAGLGESLGIWDFRFNPLYLDKNDIHESAWGASQDLELTPERLSFVWRRLAEVCFEDHRRRWLPFREMVDNLWGLGISPCWFAPCDVYATDAVFAVLPDGSYGNCQRTSVDGTSWIRDDDMRDLRQEILPSISMSDGGCGGCRYWRVCGGGCPAEAVDSDWRNRSRFCQAIYDLYSYIEQRVKGLLPNWIPVPDWTTNDEQDLMVTRQRRRPRVNALALADPDCSPCASTWAHSAMP